MSEQDIKPKGLRAAMAWIHTWLGLLAGWILFAMFLTGTASYFRPEITRWMQPELQTSPAPPARAATTAVAAMQVLGPDDDQWTIYLPDSRTTATRIQPRAKPNPDSKARPRRPEIRIDSETGQALEARATRGGEHFYRFHFQLQIPHPWGRWLAGLCAMFMLAAIISGVITHKRIFVDFFTLRWKRGQRSWLDAHLAAAVLTLPFQAMITYTGLITLMMMYMPWPIAANYASTAAFSLDAQEPSQKASGRPAVLAPVAPMVEDAMKEWGGRASRVVIQNPNDEAATVTVVRGGKDTIIARGQVITFSGVTGERLSASPTPGPAAASTGGMVGLHMGWFADTVQRWIYFALGLAGTAMVGTGLVLWTAKRRVPGTKPPFGFWLVERLNIGTIACLPVGMAAFFLANRIIPAAQAGRAELEVAVMYWVWFGLAGLALLRPVRRAWIETLALGAVAFAALPIVNALTTQRSFPQAMASGDALFIAFDAAFAAVAAALGFAAWQAARPQTARKTGKARRSALGISLKKVADAA